MTERGVGSGERAELALESRYVADLYARLDSLRAFVAAELTRVRLAGPVGSPQNRSERDGFAALHEDRLARLEAVEDRLCFGRIDQADGGRYYIGRIGLSDEEHEQLLVDWRAPAASRFYRATPAHPEGLVRRRHLALRGRTVVGLDDELLDVAALAQADRTSLTGEAALLAAVSAPRTGRMGDIVATIQADQDRIIRSPLDGVLVVQGGPGTGKTAVALHRTAYLLYTHRERLERRGVLVVGPSDVFLRYIERVLPSLGETGVVMTSLAGLLPGVEVATRGPDGGGPPPEPAPVARLKGDPRMAEVLAAAVRGLQAIVRRPVTVALHNLTLTVTPSMVAAARTRARRARLPHNQARRVYARELLGQLAREYARALELGVQSSDGALSRDEPDPERQAELIAELREAEPVRALLSRLWPVVSPRRLLTALYTDPERLARAADGILDADEIRLLARPADAGWTVTDVPLLDELAELLGEDHAAARRAAAAAERERETELRFAREVLRATGVGGYGVSAELLADRYGGATGWRSVAERAAEDRTWTYGHLVVDEAQELSAMAWRALMRRCPSRSMTVVGDLAQTSSPGAVGSWAGALDPFVAGRWRLAELTVNYRTPAEVMAVAARVLHAAGGPGVQAGGGLAAPESVRATGEPPRRVTVKDARADRLAQAVAAEVRAELETLGDGRVGVLVPASARGPLAGRLREALGEALTGAATRARTLDAPVAVLTVDDARGLEFDSVVVVEPAALVEESARGLNALYVALTRTTRRLVIVHARALPEPLEVGLAT